MSSLGSSPKNGHGLLIGTESIPAGQGSCPDGGLSAAARTTFSSGSPRAKRAICSAPKSIARSSAAGLSPALCGVIASASVPERMVRRAAARGRRRRARPAAGRTAQLGQRAHRCRPRAPRPGVHEQRAVAHRRRAGRRRRARSVSGVSGASTTTASALPDERRQLVTCRARRRGRAARRPMTRHAEWLEPPLDAPARSSRSRRSARVEPWSSRGIASYSPAAAARRPRAGRRRRPGARRPPTRPPPRRALRARCRASPRAGQRVSIQSVPADSACTHPQPLEPRPARCSVSRSCQSGSTKAARSRPSGSRSTSTPGGASSTATSYARGVTAAIIGAAR